VNLPVLKHHFSGLPKSAPRPKKACMKMWKTKLSRSDPVALSSKKQKNKKHVAATRKGFRPMTIDVSYLWIIVNSSLVFSSD
jgi:hypothetical protein